MAFKMVKEEKKPNFTEEIKETSKRFPAQSVMLAGSIIGGIPGQMAKFGHDIRNLVEGENLPYEESVVGQYLPSFQKNIQRFETVLPSLKPKNEFEKFYRNLATDTADLFLPGKILGMGKYALGPLRSLGISLSANTGGVLTKSLTGDEKKGNMVKDGLMMGLSFFNPQKAKTIFQNLYTKAEQALPTGATIATGNLNNKMDGLKRSVMGGRSYNQLAPSEKFVIDEIGKIEQSTSGGIAEVETLKKLKSALTENLSQFVFTTPDKAAKAGTRKRATELGGWIRENLEDYGKTNPEWWKYFSQADQAYGAYQKSNYISRVLDKFMKGRPEWMPHIFGLGASGLVSGFSLPVGIATTGAYQAAKYGTRIVRSKNMAKHYAKVIGAASIGNEHLIESELDKLEDEMGKEKKGKYRIVSR